MRQLFEINADVVQRAADCFQAESPDIDPGFWETLYGPFGDGPLDFGMIYCGDDWDFDDYEGNEK